MLMLRVDGYLLGFPGRVKLSVFRSVKIRLRNWSRGRVGRGGANGLCLLIADPTTDEGQARLKAILSSSDGFKIAEQDLKIRGPGHYFGRHQHGLNELRFADPLTQVDILELARKEAVDLTAQDPELEQAPHQGLRAIIHKRYPHYMDMLEAG